jgi:hypothetical protein
VLLASSPDASDIPLKNGLRVQVLPNMSVLPYARKAQSAAFVAAEGLLVVWDDGKRLGLLLLLSTFTDFSHQTLQNSWVSISLKLQSTYKDD